MKCLKFLSMLVLLVTLLAGSAVSVSAAPAGHPQAQSQFVYELQPVRAGGGGGGGGGSGGGGGGSSGSHTTGTGRGRSGPFGWIIFGIAFAVTTFGATIAFRLRLFGRYRNSRKLIRMLEHKDSAWKYKDLQKQVRQAYFLIQNAWSCLDMFPAKEVMSPALYENFQSKLYWMSSRHEQNILGDIRLLEVTPVAVYDDVDDTLDYVWFYITGSMVDYTLNTETNTVVGGSTKPEKFGEYWQFVRNEQGNWVLNQILQKDQENLLPANS